MNSFIESFVWHLSWPFRAIGWFLFGIVAIVVMVFFLSEEQMNEIEYGVEYVEG